MLSEGPGWYSPEVFVLVKFDRLVVSNWHCVVPFDLEELIVVGDLGQQFYLATGHLPSVSLEFLVVDENRDWGAIWLSIHLTFSCTANSVTSGNQTSPFT